MGARQKTPITFWCEYGSHEGTEEHGPGQTPRYSAEAQRALNRLRVRAHRERIHGPRTGWERGPGRLRKG